METRRLTEVFLDTGHAVALAKQVSEQRAQVVTTRSVLVEIGNALATVPSRPFAQRYIQAVERTAAFEIVPLSEALFERGFALYRERQDKAWGLTDCISFVVMRERGLRDALSADGDFEQAGFRALLRA